jgi:DNA-binding response OmpR family regulator
MLMQASSSSAARPNRWHNGGDLLGDQGVVLLAVEEPSVGRMLNGLFRRTGVNAYWAGDLYACMESLRECPQDVSRIFVDCHLSALDMIDFCVSARNWQPRLQLFLAGGEEARTAVNFVGDPAVVHVPKPYLPTDLAWTLRGPRPTPPAA